MTYFPDVRDENVDRFEDAIFMAVNEANPAELVEASLAACRYIESLRVNDPDVRNRVNNATSTLMRSVRKLASRAAEAEAKLKKLEQEN